MYILALDLGSKMGWAWGNDNGCLLLHGEENLIRDGWFSHESFKAFRSFVDACMELSDNLVVSVEKPHGRMPGFHAYRVLFGMYGVLQELIPDKNIIPVSSKSIKKFWTDNGNATKDDMIRVAKGCMGKDVTDNTADAIALYHYTVNQLRGSK